MTEQAKLPLSAVFERDVDLILAEEFACSADFVRWFWTRANGGRAAPHLRSLDGVTVRQRDLSGDGAGAGETDLAVDLPLTIDDRAVTYRLLIENKIVAPFQPNQPERYVARLRQAVEAKECDRGSCVLVAPAEYVTAVPGCRVFHACVTYEELLTYFEQPVPSAAEEAGRRRRFRADVFRQALTRRPGDWTPSDPGGQGTHFFRQVYELAQAVAPQLRMANPKQKSPRGWIHLYSALEQRAGFKSEICIKQDRGFADIHLRPWGGRVGRVREALGVHLDDGMSVQAAGDSAAVRVAVPAFTGERPFEEQRAAITEALAVVARLQAWYARQLPRLEELAREFGPTHRTA